MQNFVDFWVFSYILKTKQILFFYEKELSLCPKLLM